MNPSKVNADGITFETSVDIFGQGVLNADVPVYGIVKFSIPFHSCLRFPIDGFLTVLPFVVYSVLSECLLHFTDFPLRPLLLT